MEITCYRDPEIAREPRTLPAVTYNLAHTLLARTQNRCLFIPIRSMQFLAILDDEELIFLDGVRKCWINIAWQRFRPQSRNSLDEPVAYEAVYYQMDASVIMPRLQIELTHALQRLNQKGGAIAPARVLKFPAR